MGEAARECVIVVIAASAMSLNYGRPDAGDDLASTSRHYSTRSQQVRRQVPVQGLQSEPRPETSALGGRVRRTQSSTAVQRHDQTTDTTRQNDGSLVDGTYRLGSTYDEGDYDSVDNIRPGSLAMTTLSTSSLQRQPRQTATTSSSSAYTQQPQQQQQQLTGIVREHRRTHSTGVTDMERRAPAQTTYNNTSASRVRVETSDRGGGGGYDVNSLDSRNQQTGYHRVDETVQQPSTTRRQGSGAGGGGGNVMVVSNVGYEPTTLEHRAPPPSVVQSLTAADGGPGAASTPPRMNGDGGRYQSSVVQNTTVLRQHVQSPSYATTHRVQQTTAGPSSVFQRAVVVDSAQLIPHHQQQQQQAAGKQLDLLEQQLQQQQQMRQQEDEKRRVMMMRRQHEEQRQSAAEQRQPSDQLQHQMMRQRQPAVSQNVAANTPDRLPVNQVGEADGQSSRYRTSTMTTTVERSRTGGVAGNGQARLTSPPVHVTDRYQSPSTFSSSPGISLMQSAGQSTMTSADDYTAVKRAQLVKVDPRRSGGADTASSVSSSTASWRGGQTAVSGTTQHRLSTASSSAATDHSSATNDSSVGDRASPVVGERHFFGRPYVSNGRSYVLLPASANVQSCNVQFCNFSIPCVHALISNPL